ncbi:MAG: hypothetical protein IPK66_12530 [Rhodospirillales bacterium]|nr:hypothetical protein [Rhodospirillales bacterium]
MAALSNASRGIGSRCWNNAKRRRRCASSPSPERRSFERSNRKTRDTSMSGLSFQQAGELLKISIEKARGSHGREIFVKTFIPSFRMFSDLDRGLYFPHFFAWMGETRELLAVPILDQISQYVSTGKWSIVTNSVSLDILGERMGEDNIVQVRVWSGESAQSSVELFFEWTSLGAAGLIEKIAVGRMKTTWVEVIGHGVVKPRDFPTFYRDFINRMSPRQGEPDISAVAAEPLRDVSLGETLFKAKCGPRAVVPLASKSFESSLYDSTIVNNIYFSNYAMWMAKLREHHFWSLMPHIYISPERDGILKCITCNINYLREGMPFDTIHVTMSLKGLYEMGIELYFEFFREDPDGTRVKLAYGEHRAVWMAKNAHGRFRPASLPREIAMPLQQAANMFAHA